ncbi:MAG: DUF1367 family protein [Mariprofundaceae bacterium]|nr:DUF1367 family protein [Mariprofundaceae bacterium]
MADIFLTKIQGGQFVAASQQDYELTAAWKVGDVIKAKMSKPRNGWHHRKAWALVNFIFANQNIYNEINDLMVEIKLKTGHYEEHITTKGVMIYVPRSLAFSSMSQEDFNVWYDKLIDVALLHFCGGMSESKLRGYVEGVMGFDG